MTVKSSRFFYLARCTANNSRKHDEGVLLAPNIRGGSEEIDNLLWALCTMVVVLA